MPDYCDAPHCRKCIKTNEERAWCSLCARVMHSKCQQHVIIVADIRICFYCNLSPDVTLKRVDRLRDYFTQKIEEKNKRMEREKNLGKNKDSTRDDNRTFGKVAIKDIKDDIKEVKMKADMKNIAEYKQQLNANSANKVQEKTPRNPFRENGDDNTTIKTIGAHRNSRNPFNGENGDHRTAIIKKQEEEHKMISFIKTKRCNGNDKIIANKIIDLDKNTGNPFNEDSFENDGINTMMEAEMRNNEESIDKEFQEDTNNKDGNIENGFQKPIPICNRGTDTDHKTQDDIKDRKPEIDGLKNDHGNRPFSNIQDTLKIHDTKKNTKNGAQANQHQEDVLNDLETINTRIRLLESLVANDNRFGQPKSNQNFTCNLM